jgi:hypothetical protein
MSILLERVGTEQEEPTCRMLTAGVLTAELIGGNLRAIRYRGREVLRGIAYLVRDKDWATYDPVLSELEVSQHTLGFTVRYRALCMDASTRQTLEYKADIFGSADGKLTFHVVAHPKTSFLTARCGFAVLHPLAGVTGRPVRIEHVDGSIEQGVFPELIEPWQPFTEIRSITHEVAPGVVACCRMEGDIFEMEDQRNWSDASYKTYVRPITLPWPYTMEQGIPNQQSIEFHIGDSNPTLPVLVTDNATRIEIGDEDGNFPAIGLAVSPDQTAAILDHPELLAALRPQLLLFHVDPAAGHGFSELTGFAQIAAQTGHQFPSNSRIEFSLEVALSCQRNFRQELHDIARQIRDSGLPLSSWMLCPSVDRQSTPPGSPWPPCPPLADIYRSAREVFPALTLGGGMLSYFTELNRKRPPSDLLDFVSHCTCPIIHSADDLSVMQTLETLPHIVRSTRAFIGEDKPYRIGPSTIGMRQNPYGGYVMENPEHRRIVMTMDDPRQTSLFAAAWMVGYAAGTAEGHLQALAVGSLTGPLGLTSLVSESESKARIVIHPVFHIAKGLAELGQRQRFLCRSSQPSKVAAVAGMDRDGHTVLWLANLTSTNQQVLLPRLGKIHSILQIDERDTTTMRIINLPPTEQASSSLDLLPYAITCLYFAAIGQEK